MPQARDEPIVVRRYGRARLYDAAGERYVTIEQIRAWAEAGVAFSVVDAETGADVTRALLA